MWRLARTALRMRVLLLRMEATRVVVAVALLLGCWGLRLEDAQATRMRWFGAGKVYARSGTRFLGAMSTSRRTCWPS